MNKCLETPIKLYSECCIIGYPDFKVRIYPFSMEGLSSDYHIRARVIKMNVSHTDEVFDVFCYCEEDLVEQRSEEYVASEAEMEVINKVAERIRNNNFEDKGVYHYRL